jgi:2,3-bisphosphoglycerate-independent phosphoglycerate mutase
MPERPDRTARVAPVTLPLRPPFPSGPPRRVLLLFLDGVGIGEADPGVNPFFQARLPVLRGLFPGGLPSLERPRGSGPGARHFPVDATLGVEGLPQSGTGQVALLTGVNAPRVLGRHFGPWPPVRLRPLLEERNLLRQAMDSGARVIFANAYPEGYPASRDRRRVAAPAWAADAAGLLTRDHRALARREAVASEIVNDGWRRVLGLTGVPRISPREAGETLARLTAQADLTFFAHYATDLAGHRGGMAGSVEALERVDAFLGGVLDGLPGDGELLLVSDHGNVEDVRGGHTRNPALGIRVGAAMDRGGDPEDLTEVAGTVASLLGHREPGGAGVPGAEERAED